MSAKNPTTVEQTSDREIVATRTINGPARVVFEAWSRPELFGRWWVPKSFGLKLLSCALDVRVGGAYRLVFAHNGSEMAFFGRYTEVVPGSRIVWTNEEGGEAGAVTTATFEEKDGRTRITLRDRYPSKEAFDAGSGSMGAVAETFDQLEALLAESLPH